MDAKEPNAVRSVDVGNVLGARSETSSKLRCDGGASSPPCTALEVTWRGWRRAASVSLEHFLVELAALWGAIQSCLPQPDFDARVLFPGLHADSSCSRQTSGSGGRGPGSNARVLVGGTFDHLHCGHRLLLSAAGTAARAGGQVSVGVTAPEMLAAKKHRASLHSLGTRCRNVQRFMAASFPRVTTEIIHMHDEMGTSISDAAATALVLSVESFPAAEKIARLRAAANIPALEIITVPLLMSSSDAFEKTSSTDIRLKIATENYNELPPM